MRPSMLVAVLVLTAAPAACSFPDYAVVATDDSGAPAEDGDASPTDASVPDVIADADARDGASDGDAPLVDGDGEAGAACAPVQQLNFPITTATGLRCASATVMDITLPPGTEGMVFARANLALTHAAIPKITYNWTAKLEVGAADTNQIAFSSGDDMCPSAVTSKAVAGFGHVDATNNHVRLTAMQSAVLCSNGTITLGTATSIDVWIESAKPECVGKSIVVASYLEVVGTTSPAWDWPLTTSIGPIVTAKIETDATDTSLVTIATIEGTVASNPNGTCGTEVATLTMQTTLDGTVLSSSKLPVPATTAAGHLLLDTFHQAPATAGVHTLQLLGGRDFSTSKVSTGATGGDALLAIIRK